MSTFSDKDAVEEHEERSQVEYVLPVDYPEVEVDWHGHTASSDGPSLEGILSAGKTAYLVAYGAADHLNLSDRETSHDTDVRGTRLNRDVIEARREQLRKYNDRDSYEHLNEEDIIEALTMLGEDLEDLDKEVARIASYEEYRDPPIILDSVEIDYESGEERILEELEENDFDYPVISVHFIDGAYVKDEEEVLDTIFEDMLGFEDYDQKLTDEEAREVIRQTEAAKEYFVEMYFQNLHSLLDSEIAEKYDVMVCHPSLIERNTVLNHQTTENRYDRLVEAFQESEAVPDFSVKGVERQVSEEIREEFEKDYNGEKREVDDEIALKLIEDVAEKDETVFLRKLLQSDLDIAYSSDAHRDWEIPSRKHMAQILLGAWDREVIDLEGFFSEEGNDSQKNKEKVEP